MSIRIDHDKCRSCGACIEICPGSLIERDSDGKAWMKYPMDCWGCASCIKECRFGAIALFLGADIGGRGGQMTVQTEGNILHWQVTDPAGLVKQIDVDRKAANKY